MPYQVRLNPQSQRKDTGGYRSPGGGDDVGSGGFNRRPQLIPDHGIDLPKLVVQLGATGTQAEGLPDGGLFLSERLAVTRVDMRSKRTTERFAAQAQNSDFDGLPRDL